ncbi:MAG TPA: helix-turn-helix domain-containing protein [Steroidobacteraceae bacterium]
MSELAAPPGLRLKAERERRGLSAQKAADELHLDRWVIDALEADDYKRVGPTVYAKGHLKKYAALLGLPAAEILAGYESGAQSPVGTASPRSNILLAARADAPHTSALSPPQIAACVTAACLVLVVLWWRPWHPRIKVPASRAPVAEASAPAAPEKLAGAGLAAPAVSAPVAARDAPPASTAAADTDSAAAPTVNESAVPGAGHARLRLSFSADSWVDIHDAQGKRLFSGNGLANSVKNVAGAAPVRVFLGYGSGVQLEINDRTVAIGPQFFAGDVARFEAGSDGVLRRDSHAEQSRGAPPHNARPPG